MSLPARWLWMINVVLFFQTFCCVNTNSNCVMNKHIFTNKSGEIHNGAVSTSPCEWLIQGKPNEVIAIRFNLSNSRFGFDYFYVHDGNSQKLKLLASVTGTQQNIVLFSTGPSMYLILHAYDSDSRQSLDLSYSIKLRNSSIIDGIACKTPSRSSKFIKRSWTPEPGIAQGSWHVVSEYSRVFGKRAGHISGYVISADKLFVHGGYSLTKMYEDFISFDFKTTKWCPVGPVGSKPPSLYNHASVVYKNQFILYGGELIQSDQPSQTSSQLWVYHVITNTWKLQPTTNEVPSVAGHTMTLVGSTIYVIGGRSDDGQYLTDILTFDINLKSWNVIKPSFGKPSSLRLYGHSACYYVGMESIVVFGGFHSENSMDFAVNTNELRLYHVNGKIWSIIEPANKKNIPPPTSFHVAAIVGDYMFINGGWTNEAKNYDLTYSVYSYNFICHGWMKEGDRVLGNKNNETKAVFSHSIAMKDQQTLILSGGFNHTGPVSRVLTLNLPDNIVVNIIGPVVCSNYDKMECGRDPCCATCWNKCYSSSDIPPFNCDIPKHPCAVFSSCVACSSQKKCKWCALNSICYDSQDVLLAKCKSNSVGWWKGINKIFTLISSPLQCEIDDRPPGITLVEYLQPKNDGYPVNVKIVDKINWRDERPRDITHEIFWLGRIYPYTGESDTETKHTLQFRGKGVNVWLNISMRNWDPVMGTVTRFFGDYKQTGIGRRDNPNQNLRIFPVRKGDGKKNMELWYHFVMSGTVNYEMGASMKIYRKLNGDYMIINRTLLEPYSTHDCSQYQSCMSCITDASCGWCPALGMCMKPVERSVVCKDKWNNNQFYLRRRQEQCTVCEDHADCDVCMKDKLCTWDSKQACIQRSVASSNIIVQCKPSCRSRMTIDECVSGERCTWCTGRQSCISTGQFIIQNQFGQCRVFMTSVPEKCSISCSCETCLTKFSCGWLYDTSDSRNGSCLPGDYSGNWSRTLHQEKGLTGWTYDSCPDVDECSLGIAQCQPHSTCINKLDATKYECRCDQGYEGDGNIGCNKTCWPPCGEHGTCIANYTCVCNLGWKGENCSIDCGCNGHSTCVNQTGVCDRCQEYTTGRYCQFCVNGSYGDAATAVGCEKCQCNGHRDLTRNLCNTNTGECFCTNNTAGHNCEKCKDNFSGDPKTDMCILSCQRSNIFKNAASGFVAPYNHDIKYSDVANATRHHFASCLWTIVAFDTNHEGVIFPERILSTAASSILFTVHQLNISCFDSSLKIYNSVPPNPRNVSSISSEFKLLGTVCGDIRNLKPVYFRATSGFLTLVYDGPLLKDPVQSIMNMKANGFIGEFKVLRCPGSCPLPYVCNNGTCECPDRFKGAVCEHKTCQNDCNNANIQGECDKKTGQCICKNGFIGSDCSVNRSDKRTSHQTFFATHHVTSFNQSITATSGWTYDSYGGTMEYYKGSVYIFGNSDTDSDTYNGHFLSYDLNMSTWKYLSGFEPKNRRLHCSFVYQDEMFIYGGILKNGKMTGELFGYRFTTQSWVKHYLKGREGDDKAVAGHTCTRVGQEIYVIGGFSPSGQLNEHIHTINLKTMQHSLRRNPNTLKPVGIHSHVTVYDVEANFLYIHGGFVYFDGKMGVSNQVFVVDVNNGPKLASWYHATPLMTDEHEKVPSLIGHAAYFYEGVIYILGGYNEQEGYNQYLYRWNVMCNRWIKIHKNDTNWHGNGCTNRMFSSVVSINSSLYMFGGLNDNLIPTLSMFTLPKDGNRKNHSYECLGNEIAHRCDTFSSCESCVSPFVGNDSRCSWCRCPELDGNENHCVAVGQDCNCASTRSKPLLIEKLHKCTRARCPFSSCKRCREHKDVCFWSNLFVIASNGGRYESQGNALPYTCDDHELIKNSLNGNPQGKRYRARIDKEISNACPEKCSVYKMCGKCIQELGINAGTDGCVWSQKLKECFSTILIPVKCVNGMCGRIYGNRTNSECPKQSCSIKENCISCIDQEECGWCSQDDKGSGTCMDGDSLKPFHESCGELSNWKRTVLPYARKNISWTFSECRLENECLNNNISNICKENEDCRDIERGYVCDCKEGYRRLAGQSECLPYCTNGCSRGVCVAPNQCMCMFGYTGIACNVSCACNGHSNCTSTDINNCFNCQNNTRGKYCDQCLPLFVGDPINNGKCIPCRTICNGITDYCMRESESVRILDVWKDENMETFKAEVDKLWSGPQFEKDTICLLCGNNAGEKCEKCKSGYFNIGNGACTQCQCNDHADICDENTGLNCACDQNTRSDPTCTNNCYKQQCSKCMPNYIGDPRNGKPCYKKIHTSTPEWVNTSFAGTSFFAVQGRLKNVNIRIFIDAVVGNFEVYITVKSNETQSQLSSGTRFHTKNRRDTSMTEYLKLQSTYIVLKDMRRRTVITIPCEDYNLLDGDIFLVELKPINLISSEKHRVMVYYRQDLPELDAVSISLVVIVILFVIVSGVMTYVKFRVSFWRRMRDNIIQVELDTMRSRPFASFDLLLQPNRSTMLPKVQRVSRIVRGGRRLNPDFQSAVGSLATSHRKHIEPVAVQFTDDNRAAVFTAFVQFPANEISKYHFSLGSGVCCLDKSPLHPHVSHHNRQHNRRNFPERENGWLETPILYNHF